MRPDTGHGDSGISSPPGRGTSGAGAPCPGASAMTTWQFVPPTPKELTPASSGESGHGPDVVCTRRFSASGSMRGLGLS